MVDVKFSPDKLVDLYFIYIKLKLTETLFIITFYWTPKYTDKLY